MMMYFHTYAKLFEWLFPSFLWRIRTTKKVIYLTFDDGPIPEATPQLLTWLNQYHAKATFFCVGENIEKHRDLFDRLIEEGHQVGNHTFNHLNGRKVDQETYLNNVEAWDRVAAPAKTTLFRPPYGRLPYPLIKKIKKRYQIVLWNVLSADFDPHLNKDKALKTMLKGTKPGSIVLFHDNEKHFHNTAYLLPKYLREMTARGYSFQALPC